MTENIDAEVIKRTQDALGKYVKKPPLTDKLLRKPPFKFILDIVKAVSDFFIVLISCLVHNNNILYCMHQ